LDFRRWIKDYRDAIYIASFLFKNKLELKWESLTQNMPATNV